ncbi:DUF4177 domain-containing protein [Phaeovulum sp.]|uniref:DUF4177 domain-containing protein n=1 Tax=Phaeovulum sp. TaxID=2934796 RepID=UPI00356628A3
MQAYEYSAIPAPARADKNRALKTSGERFGATLAAVMNRMAAEGWEYLRADVLPCEERSGLTSRTTVWHNLLIFRRPLPETDAETLLPPEEPASAKAEDPVEAEKPGARTVPSFLAASKPGAAPRLSTHTEAGPTPRLGPASPEA